LNLVAARRLKRDDDLGIQPETNHIPIKVRQLYLREDAHVTMDQGFLKEVHQKEETMKIAEQKLRSNQCAETYLEFCNTLGGLRRVEKRGRQIMVDELERNKATLSEMTTQFDIAKKQLHFLAYRVSTADLRYHELGQLLVNYGARDDAIEDSMVNMAALASAERDMTERRLRDQKKETKFWMEKQSSYFYCLCLLFVLLTLPQHLFGAPTRLCETCST
jgi:hypothetical protein